MFNQELMDEQDLRSLDDRRKGCSSIGNDVRSEAGKQDRTWYDQKEESMAFEEG